MSAKDMMGLRFGSLTVIDRAPSDRYGNAMWLCRCDCGKEIVTQGHAMRNGHTRSCGHLQKEVAMANGTHHLSKDRLYKVWSGMRQRCENPNNRAYRDYGAKGVTVCEAWKDFEVFYRWMIAHGYRRGLTIDRIDNSKGYSPENCRLATRMQQNQNTSRTHKIECDGGFITAAQAGRAAGVSRSTVAKWARDGKVRSLNDVYELKRRIAT